MAGVGEQNGSAAGSWRGELQGIGPVDGTQGADYGWRFRNGSRGGAREGADVAINYFPTEEPDAKEMVELIKKAGREAVALPGDLRDEAFCKKLIADAVDQLGGLDILVCNAARQ